MKKILLLITLIIFVFSSGGMVLAQTAPDYKIYSDENTEAINRVGHKILKANNLPEDITFHFSEEDHVNAYANIDKEVYVYKGLMKLIEKEDELAGVIGHEIGHICNKHIEKQTLFGAAISGISALTSKILNAPVISKIADGLGVLSMLKVSRSAEYEADLTGADLMINAGYDPKGMLSLLNKISQNYIDIIQTHPSGDKRLTNLYDYIAYNYPDKVQDSYPTESYKKFEVFINGVIAERQADPKKMADYEKKQAKLREERIKRAERIEKGSTGWDAAFNVLFSSQSDDNL